jgi:signal transduction histidine kinase
MGGWCTVYLEGTAPVQLAVAHQDAYARKLARKFCGLGGPLKPSPELPQRHSGDACLTRIDTRDELRMLEPSRERRDLLRRLGIKSFIHCPLHSEFGPIGAVTLVSTDRTFDEVHLKLAAELSRMFSVYLENARLFEESTAQKDMLQRAVNSRDIFLSICSHELRTPVTSLKLLTQITRRQLSRGQYGITAENFELTLGKFSHQVDRLTQLIEDMLDVSRIESGNFIYRKEPLDLSELLREMADRLAIHFQELEIKFEVDIDTGVRVVGDRVRLEQVCLNLINNALKYGERSPVRLRLKRGKGTVIIRVEDSGIGIPSEMHERIFRRFERVREDLGITGLGLGLFISKNIIDHHQGSIRVDSEPGAGSTFSVYLPCAEASLNPECFPQ